MALYIMNGNPLKDIQRIEHRWNERVVVLFQDSKQDYLPGDVV